MENLENKIENSFLGRVKDGLNKIRYSTISKIAVYSMAGVLGTTLSFGCGDKAATSYSEASDEKNSQPKEDCFIPGQSGQMTTMTIPKYTYDESGKLTGTIGKGGQSTEYTLNIYKKIPCVTADFINNGDGTITDKAHGLMWTIEATPDEHSLGGAVEVCKNVKNAGGYADWRVPAIEELWTLWTEKTPCHFPPIFQGKCWRYWTSTPAPAGWTDNYFAVYFESSYPMLQAVRYQGNWMPSTVRCVRSAGERVVSENQTKNQAIANFFHKVKITSEAVATRNLSWAPCKIEQAVINQLFGGENLRQAEGCFKSLIKQCICPPKSAELIVDNGTAGTAVIANSSHDNQNLKGCLYSIGNDIIKSMDVCSVRWQFKLSSSEKEYNDYCSICPPDGSARTASNDDLSEKLAIAMAGAGSEFVSEGTGNYGRIHGLGTVNTNDHYVLGKKRDRIYGKIALGSGSTTGYCDKNNLQEVVRRRAGAIRACYEEQLQIHPTLEGKITARWTLSTDGAVHDASVIQSSVGNAQVENCVLRYINMMRFAKSVDGICIVQWPFVFSSDGNHSASDTSANSGSVKLNDLLRQSAKSDAPDSDTDGNPRLDSKMLARLMSGKATNNSAECDLKKFNKNSEYIDCSTSQRVFVRAFNIDDTGEVLLDGRRILQVGYREDSGYVDITSHIKSGMNFLRFIAKNQLGGYTWGLEIRCGDGLKYSSVAGQAGKFGAHQNDYTKTKQIVFDCTLPIILKKD
ncbi:DUF1566 domain-containing protein [Candidatus Woesearchaeota archaeon]|nr:DUF1566 domain-containing protein [Candidatus Woesearchaeota archaeon]